MTAPSGSAGTGGDDTKEESRFSAGSGRHLVAESEALVNGVQPAVSWCSFENSAANAEFNASALVNRKIS